MSVAIGTWLSACLSHYVGVSLSKVSRMHEWFLLKLASPLFHSWPHSPSHHGRPHTCSACRNETLLLFLAQSCILAVHFITSCASGRHADTYQNTAGCVYFLYYHCLIWLHITAGKRLEKSIIWDPEERILVAWKMLFKTRIVCRLELNSIPFLFRVPIQ